LIKPTVILTAALLCVLSPLSFAVEAAPSSADEKTSAKPLRILCVGDSITAGYTDNPKWDVPFEFGYRQGLFERLQKAGYQISASSGVRRGGWRSPGPSSPAITSQEIEVVNLWPNRLIGDGKLPVEEQRTRTNIGTKKSAPLTSGLLGPVRLLISEK